MTTGTKDDPWRLTTPPGSSAYEMYRDTEADPEQLVCQVGSTRLTYLWRAVDDLHAWLVDQGDWVPLGAADEKKEPAAGTVEAWAARPTTRSAAGTACARATGAGSGCTCRRSSRRSGWPRSPTTPATTRCGPAVTETRVIRYRTTPECADDNARLIAAVFDELADQGTDRHPLHRPPARRRRDLPARRHRRRGRQPAGVVAGLRRLPVRPPARLEDGPFPATATVIGSHGDALGG